MVLGTVTDGEFGSLRTQGENQPLHLWQIIHDAKEAARKMSKKLLMECLQLKSGISDMFYKTGKYVIDLISINDYYLLY